MNTNQYLAGQKDCDDGKEQQSDDEDYLRGYACQYQHEQNLTHYSELMSTIEA